MDSMVEYVAGFSDDGKGIQKSEIMKAAMRKAKSLCKIISAHCEDCSLLHGGVIHDGNFAKENNLDIKSVFYETLEEYSNRRLFGTAIFSSNEKSEKDQELIEKLTKRIEMLESNLKAFKFELSKPKITEAPVLPIRQYYNPFRDTYKITLAFVKDGEWTFDEFSYLAKKGGADLNGNGSLTLGENLADHGGLQVSFNAFKHATADKPLETINGFTPEQRFFLAYSGVWAGNITEKEIRSRTKSDPHSLGQWRVDGALPHINAWYEAFDIKPDNKMFIPETERVDLW